MTNGILEDIVARLDRIEKSLSLKASANGNATASEPEENEDETPRKRTRGPGRPKSSEVTQDEIKVKLKAVLEKKGRATALSILEEFDAEKIGEIDKDNYAAFAKACDKALSTAASDNDDLDLD